MWTYIVPQNPHCKTIKPKTLPHCSITWCEAQSLSGKLRKEKWSSIVSKTANVPEHLGKFLLLVAGPVEDSFLGRIC